MYKTTTEVIELVESFENRTLREEEWTHAAHLTVGLYYILRFPFGAALNYMRDGIVWLNDAHGIPNTNDSGYSETLTVFWLVTIKQFTEVNQRCNIADLANDLIAACGNPKLPLRYYSRDLLFSPQAREQHVQPDLDTFYMFRNLAKLTAHVGSGKALQFV